MRRRDLIDQLTQLTVDLESVVTAAPATEQLRELCRSARLAFGAAAVSVAVVEDEIALHYVASSGAGAEQIVGTRLPLGAGLASYVAQTGQSLAIERPFDDPRFAREVAESTGFIPSSMLITPISSKSGHTLGVLSVLDRASGGHDALELAAAFATSASLIVHMVEDTARLARILVGAVQAAAATSDDALASGLARATRDLPAADDELATIAATLTAVRAMDPVARDRVIRLIADIVELATPRRRR